MKRSLALIMMAAAAFTGLASTASPGEEIRIPLPGGQLELSFKVCSLNEGNRCKEESMTFFADNVTPFQCMLYGQIEISKWQEAHPNWSMHGWKCRAAGQFANL